MSRKTMEYLKKAIPVFTMLQDENRQEILMILFEKGELQVNQITEYMKLSRPTVSHHLKLLYLAGLVKFRKEGKERIYHIEFNEALNDLKNIVSSMEKDLKK